jgi:hypothetical protein
VRRGGGTETSSRVQENPESSEIEKAENDPRKKTIYYKLGLITLEQAKKKIYW